MTPSSGGGEGKVLSQVSKSASNITLLIPGLLEPFSGIDPALFPALPALSTLLGKASCSATPDNNFETMLCRFFNLSPNEKGELPIAQLTWLADFGSQSGSALLRADPVHLRPDKAEVRLFPVDQLALTAHETEQLIASLNEHCRRDGLEFIAATPFRWYVRLIQEAALTTQPLTVVAGKDIRHYLPRGADAAYWKTLFNEIQMLLHAHPINQARRDKYQPTINSLWFWGGSPVSNPGSKVNYFVAGEDPLTKGLANLSGATFKQAGLDYPSVKSAVEGQVNSLIVYTGLMDAVACGDFNAWCQRLAQVEQSFFAPLLSAMKKGRFASAELLPCNGKVYRIKRHQLFKFWRSAQPFKSYLK